MIVKICGLAREKDARACASLGAPMLGFICIPRSKRFMEIEEVGKILAGLGSGRKKFCAVLVLEPSSPQDVLQAVAATGADSVQLYSLSPSQAASLRGKGVFVFRAIAIPAGSQKLSIGTIKQIGKFAKVCDGLFFDVSANGKAGGTGKQIRFGLLEQAASVAKNANRKIAVFISGGMDLQRLRKLSCNKSLLSLVDGVDANSGVESSPGKKDLGKLSAFVSFAKKIRP